MQERSEHPEPLPFILLAYAPDESIGAEIERARIAKAIAANRLKEIHFISDFLPRLRPAGQEYGRATILNPNDELLEAARIRRRSFGLLRVLALDGLFPCTASLHVASSRRCAILANPEVRAMAGCRLGVKS
jgi:hypothetical protein